MIPACSLALCVLLAGGETGLRPDVAAELSRLEGHEVRLAPDGRHYEIQSVAGEGRPLVGVVERRGDSLLLRTESGAPLRLTGPLAVPRIAGPGYRVWVLGAFDPLTLSLRARRIGVLAPPSSRRGQGAGSTRASWTSIAPKPRVSAPPGT